MVRTVTIARDLTVDLKQDRPGMLARAATAIASGGLNLDGFAEIDGLLHVLTSDPRSARLSLEAAGLGVLGEREVIVVKVENRRGAAAEVFRRVAEKQINIAYTYVASRDRIVIAAEDPERAVDVLRLDKPSDG